MSSVLPPPPIPVRRVGWMATVLVAVCLVVAADFVGTVVFASWTVTTFYPLYLRLRGRTRSIPAALLLTCSILLVVMAPLAVTGVLLVTRLLDLFAQAQALLHGGSLSALVESLAQEKGVGLRLGDLYREAARATPDVLASVGHVFEIVSKTVVKAFLFVLSVYGLFIHGARARAWLVRASPFDDRSTRELMAVYAETGRGILIGVFLVVLLHGAVATVGYWIVGIGRAAELGSLTAVAGLVPGIGTGLVWLPLAIVLAATDHVGQAIGVTVVGIAVGSVDNLARPWLSRLGKVPLPTLPLFVAFFGGIATFGASGILLGPLLFAWGKRAAELAAERKDAQLT